MSGRKLRTKKAVRQKLWAGKGGSEGKWESGEAERRLKRSKKKDKMSSPVTAIVAKRDDCRKFVYDKKKRDSDET